MLYLVNWNIQILKLKHPGISFIWIWIRIAGFFIHSKKIDMSYDKVQFFDFDVFFLEHVGELRIIVLIEEKRVIHRPKSTYTPTTSTT